MARAFDVKFYTHASQLTGFGHASRCVKIAKRLQILSPNLKIGFSGEFEKNALDLMQAQFLMHLDDDTPSKLSVYDRMDDHQVPENYDLNFLNSVISKSDEVIFIANGLRPPHLPAGVGCIGYKYGGYEANGPNIFWGLQFAPTDIQSPGGFSGKALKTGMAFVALGGASGTENLENVLKALFCIRNISEVSALLSPVNNSSPSLIYQNQKKRVKFFRSVDDVNSFFSAAEIVVTSYGHLGYEAMASGCAVCLFGQKKFQSEYARKLEEIGVCVAGGLLDELSPLEIKQAIEKTVNKSEELKENTSRRIDGNGINRIAELILQKLTQ